MVTLIGPTLRVVFMSPFEEVVSSLKLLVDLTAFAFMGPLSLGCLIGRFTFERRFWAAVCVLPGLCTLAVLVHGTMFLFPCYRSQEIRRLRTLIQSFSGDTVKHGRKAKAKAAGTLLTLRIDDLRVLLIMEYGMRLTDSEVAYIERRCAPPCCRRTQAGAGGGGEEEDGLLGGGGGNTAQGGQPQLTELSSREGSRIRSRARGRWELGSTPRMYVNTSAEQNYL